MIQSRLVTEAEDDRREFQRAKNQHRRLTALKLGVAGIVLIPIAIAARRWADGLQAVQGDSDVQVTLPSRVIAASWGGLLVGGACILTALLLFVLAARSGGRAAPGG